MDFPVGIVVAHYLQSVTPALALGGELVYHRRPGEEGTVTSLLGRYTGTFVILMILSLSFCIFTYVDIDAQKHLYCCFDPYIV